jgi:hypothetical protein
MPKHAAPWGGPVVALLAAVHDRTRRESCTRMGCSAASAGRQGQLYADAPLDRTAMRSGAQSLTHTVRNPPSLAGGPGAGQHSRDCA